jgi:hypothetical protein
MAFVSRTLDRVTGMNSKAGRQSVQDVRLYLSTVSLVFLGPSAAFVSLPVDN